MALKFFLGVYLALGKWYPVVRTIICLYLIFFKK